MAKHRQSSRRPAFTLIEMTLVIATIAVLSAIAIPRYARAMSRYRVELAAKRVAADFMLARSLARATGNGQVIDFTTPANGYTLPGVSSPNGQPGDYAVKLSDAPYTAKVTSVSFGAAAATSVRFTRFGTPESGGGVVVSSGDFQKAVLLDAVTGRAEVR